jgi:hypothetical protein
VRIFAARIGHVVRRRPRLLYAWNHLPADRILGIVSWDQIKKMWRNSQREFVAREQNTAALLIAKIEVLFQVSE